MVAIFEPPCGKFYHTAGVNPDCPRATESFVAFFQIGLSLLPDCD